MCIIPPLSSSQASRALLFVPSTLESLETDLLQSAEEGDSERVREILQEFPNKEHFLRIRNREKRSTLSLAALYGRFAVVKELTEFLAATPEVLEKYVNEKDHYGNHSLLLVSDAHTHTHTYTHTHIHTTHHTHTYTHIHTHTHTHTNTH